MLSPLEYGSVFTQKLLALNTKVAQRTKIMGSYPVFYMCLLGSLWLLKTKISTKIDLNNEAIYREPRSGSGS